MTADLPQLIKLQAYRDSRGYFMETWNKLGIDRELGHSFEFVQDNLSSSLQWVLRGLHYQLQPRAQGKLVGAVRGEIFDVAVDVRRSSPTFGRWWGFSLSESSFTQLWVPPGFAHGFLALTKRAVVMYKVTDYYAPELERAIRWDDPDIAIKWPLGGVVPLVSDKDMAAPNLSDADAFE